MDLMSRMSGAGLGSAPSSAREDAVKRMRRAFFDAWADHCDEFMRSEVFLDAMKKSMDGALAFKQQVNEFLTRSLHENQMPARSDTDSIMLVLRSMEERVLERIDQLSGRVERLEGTTSSRPRVDEPAKARSQESLKPRSDEGTKGKGSR